MALVEAVFVGMVLFVVLSLLFIGWKSPEIVVFLALVLVWNAGTISTEDALSGFTNPGVLAVGSLFVVIKGVERSRLADKAAKHVFGLRTSFTAGLLRLMGLAFLLSAFLNNTPVVALLIPITKNWAMTRGFSPALLLMPLSFACIFGGLATIIGTSTNLIVQGLVIEADLPALGFFEPGYIGIPLGVAGMLYLAVASPRVLARADDGSGGEGAGDGREREDELLTEVQVSHDFGHFGMSVAPVLAHLGLPAEALVKIKRRRPTAFAATDDGVCVPGFTASSNSEGPGWRHLAGDRWHSTIDGSPISIGAAARSGCSGASSPLGKLSAGTEGGALTSSARPESKHREPAGSGAMPHLSDLRVGKYPLRGGEDEGQERVLENDSGLLDDIGPVSPLELLQDGDVLVLSCPTSTMISFLGSMVSEAVRGLKILGSTAERLQRAAEAAWYLEIVLSDCNDFIGCSPASTQPASSYQCCVVAVRRASVAGAVAHAQTTEEGEPLQGGLKAGDGLCFPDGHDGESVSSPLCGVEKPRAAGLSATVHDAYQGGLSPGAAGEAHYARRCTEAATRPLAPGDVVLVLAQEGFLEMWKNAPDFDLVTQIGEVPSAVTSYDYLSLLVFCGMLGWVLFSSVPMVRAAFAAGGVLIVGGWVDPKKCVGYVDWALLLLVGSALGLSKAIANSGLAGYAGNAIRESGMSASASLYIIYGFTMVCTELITNNAAAALAVPIALSIAEELEVSYKPFVLTVMMAASSSFITPIGYQTNTMVWAPGGYKFTDFIRLGTPLSFIYLVVGSFLMPYLFPF